MLSVILPTEPQCVRVVWSGVSQKLNYSRPNASNSNLHSFISFLNLMVNDGAVQFDHLTGWRTNKNHKQQFWTILNMIRDNNLKCLEQDQKLKYILPIILISTISTQSIVIRTQFCPSEIIQQLIWMVSKMPNFWHPLNCIAFLLDNFREPFLN